MITANISTKRTDISCTKCFKCEFPMIENKCGKFGKEVNQLKRILISHPYANKRQNLEAIKHICKALVPFNIIPISPVLMFSFMNDQVAEERCKGLEWCDELIELVDAVFLCGAWETSEGCCRERDAALMLMKPVYIIDGWRDGVPLWRGEGPKWWQV